MPDMSYLDSKYFIDEYVFNCPFCNRRNVAYSVKYPVKFDWTDDKKCYVYLAECKSCGNVSMNLTFEEMAINQLTDGSYRFRIGEDENLDEKFFYSVPTSFFSLDVRIPRVLRELMTEAEGCLKSNFLTGASVCARKLVYELSLLEGAEGADYESRLKSLKGKRPDVEAEYFDTLLTIQQVTSDKVHELSYDGWKSGHLRVILATLTEIFNAMYVIPKLRAEKRQSILELKEEVFGKKKPKQ
jgi:transcription elongation factor Elf1